MLIRRAVSMVMVVMTLTATVVLAHSMTLKGTIAGIEPKRIQLKTGEEKKGEGPAWIEITAKTKIMRGKAAVTFGQAKITVGERAVVIVDHEADGVMRATEIRLAAM